MVNYLERTSSLIADDDTLGQRWLPVWESNYGMPLAEAVGATTQELLQLAHRAASAAEMADGADDAVSTAYRLLANDIGALASATRGAGHITALLSLWIAWIYRSRPLEGLHLCGRLLGSDTDTIATMAGALLGAVADADPPQAPLDAALIESEAARLYALGEGARIPSFPHPDPLLWEPPRSLSDAVGLLDGETAVAGLGSADALGGVIEGQGKQPGLWQWLTTEYGQRLLAKRRATLRELPDGARPRARAPIPPDPERPVGQPSLFGDSYAPSDVPKDPEVGAALVAASAFDHALMGELLEHFGAQGPAAAAAFAIHVSEHIRQDEPTRDEGVDTLTIRGSERSRPLGQRRTREPRRTNA